MLRATCRTAVRSFPIVTAAPARTASTAGASFTRSSRGGRAKRLIPLRARLFWCALQLPENAFAKADLFRLSVRNNSCQVVVGLAESVLRVQGGRGASPH